MGLNRTLVDSPTLFLVTSQNVRNPKVVTVVGEGVGVGAFRSRFTAFHVSTNPTIFHSEKKALLGVLHKLRQA